MEASGARRIGPEWIVFAGCAIALVGFGPRASSGLFQLPMIQTYGWGRDTFGLAIAIQNLLWGIGSPFSGALADRYGVTKVLWVGAILYASGVALMAYADTPGMLYLSAGVLVGFGLSAASFNLILGAFGKLLPESWRPLAFGAGTAAGSFGQFFYPPIGNILIENFGWQDALLVFAASVLVIMPLAVLMATRPQAGATVGPNPAPGQSIRQALGEAIRHPSFIFLTLGFFTCGFQLAFVTVHLPAYLKDAGLATWVGGWTLAAIGLANAVGSLTAGWLSGKVSKRWLLAWIYFGRGVVIAVFLMFPVTPTSCILFGIFMGLLWLSTVPPTSGLVMMMFGTRYMAMLYGLVFLSHQVGGFLGVWLAGVLYEARGSYDVVWWASVVLSFASALINLPIRERPVQRPALAAA